jgi:hypothetical protein
MAPPSPQAAADEITPLLAGSSNSPINPANESSVLENEEERPLLNGQLNGNAPDANDDDKPLPMGQIFILSLARVIDPIAFFSIFPFVPSMVESMDVAEVDVGFYTGLIVRTSPPCVCLLSPAHRS